MVQDVERRRPELEGSPLAQLHSLGNRQVGDVGHVRLGYVSWRVAERSPKDRLRRSAVDDVTDLAVVYVHGIPRRVDRIQADQLLAIGADGGNWGPRGVRAHTKEIAGIAEEDPHVRDGGAGATQERTRRIEASIERSEKLAVKKVAGSRRRCDPAELRRRVTLARLQQIVRRNGPSSKRMPQKAMLLFEERQLLSHQEAEGVRIIQSRVRVLAVLGTDRILRHGYRIAATQAGKDFADVIQRLTVGIGDPQRRLLPQVVGTELGLYGLIIGESTVGARTYNTLAAICASQVGGGGLARR